MPLLVWIAPPPAAGALPPPAAPHGDSNPPELPHVLLTPRDQSPSVTGVLWLCCACRGATTKRRKPTLLPAPPGPTQEMGTTTHPLLGRAQSPCKPSPFHCLYSCHLSRCKFSHPTLLSVEATASPGCGCSGQGLCPYPSSQPQQQLLGLSHTHRPFQKHSSRQARAAATTQSSAGLPHSDGAPHPEREPPPKGEGTSSQETPAVQNISHLLVHTAKHSLNMHSTLIGHISTGSQVPEQSSGAGAGRADTDPPAETFIWS